jgi:hypothetical protein
VIHNDTRSTECQIVQGFKIRVSCIGRTFKDIYNLTEKSAFHDTLKSRVTVHRPGDDPCQECDRCACVKCHGECRVATIDPAWFRTVHTLTARYSKRLVSPVCACLNECCTNSSPIFSSTDSCSLNRAMHSTLLSGIITWSVWSG